MDEVAIRISDVYKDFRLPHERTTTIKSEFTGALRETFGRRRIETQHALKGISFEIKKGEFFGVVGRNGSGKSTLLKILAGIYQPTKGRVDINGRVVPFIELGVGFNAELSGRDNVYLNGAVLGFSHEEVGAKYKQIVEFAELENFMDQKLKNYSSGMQVRLAFSVATILADSDILLIDEVLAVGDSSFQKKCFGYFNKLKRLKKTVVFVSHDMAAVAEYCNKAVLINDGKIHFTGDAEKIAKEYLKLFQEDRSTIVKNREKRWGTGKVQAKSIKITVDDKHVKISVDLIGKAKDVHNPIVGFLLKHSNSNINVLGTNTRVESVKTDSITRHQKKNVTFEFQNILNDSDYLIDIAVLDSTGLETLDWWEEAAVISGRKQKRSKTNSAVQIPITIKVTDKNA